MEFLKIWKNGWLLMINVVLFLSTFLILEVSLFMWEIEKPSESGKKLTFWIQILIKILHHHIYKLTTYVIISLLILISVLLSIVLLLFLRKPHEGDHLTTAFKISKKGKKLIREAAKEMRGKTLQSTKSENLNMDWFNLISQHLFRKRICEKQDRIVKMILAIVNEKVVMPDAVGPITFRNLSLGDTVPEIITIGSQVTTEGDLLVNARIRYEGQDAKVHLASSVLIHYPVKNFASFPFEVSIENLFFDASISIRVTSDLKSVQFRLTEEPAFDLVFMNELGKSKLKNPPYLSELVNSIIDANLTKLVNHAIDIDLQSLLKKDSGVSIAIKKISPKAKQD